MFAAQVIEHINKKYGSDLDVDVTLPKIKGNFKGSHNPIFDIQNVVFLE